jgi:hypothetical protein
MIRRIRSVVWKPVKSAKVSRDVESPLKVIHTVEHAIMLKILPNNGRAGLEVVVPFNRCSRPSFGGKASVERIHLVASTWSFSL